MTDRLKEGGGPLCSALQRLTGQLTLGPCFDVLKQRGSIKGVKTHILQELKFHFEQFVKGVTAVSPLLMQSTQAGVGVGHANPACVCACPLRGSRAAHSLTQTTDCLEG